MFSLLTVSLYHTESKCLKALDSQSSVSYILKLDHPSLCDQYHYYA